MRIMIHVTVVPDDESENWKETAKSFNSTQVISKQMFRSIPFGLKGKWLAKEIDEPVNEVITAAKIFISEVIE